jgi:hypothetical protein
MSIIFENGYSITQTPTLVRSGLVFNLQTAPSSGTTWIDESGNGYNATISGSATYVSNNGGGIKLVNTRAGDGGGSDFISVPYNIASNTTTIEIVASFNPTGFWATIWGNETYNSSAGYFAYMTTATAINYGRPNAHVQEAITASNSIRHWIFVLNGTNRSLYLNGSQIGSTQTGTNGAYTTNNFYFGSRHQNAGTAGPRDVMNSSVTANQPVFYQMRVYSKALSAAEITQNFNVVRGTYGL